MTKETLDRAENIRDQIVSIDRLLLLLCKHDYALDPPTRRTSINLVREAIETGWERELNEGEVVTIRDALAGRRQQLELEFEKL